MAVFQEPKHHHMNPFSSNKTKRSSIIKKRKFSIRSMDRKESSESMNVNPDQDGVTNKGKLKVIISIIHATCID